MTAATTTEQTKQDALDDAIRAAFSHPHDVAACGRLMDKMRFTHRMNYDACVARVARVVPGADFESIASEADDLEATG